MMSPKASAEYPVEFTYTLSIFLLIENVLALVCNSVVLFGFHNSKKSLHIQGNAFIISLNLLDVLVCLTAVPTTVALLVTSRSQTKLFCYFHEAFVSLASSASATNLLVISLDRYDSVLYPLSRHVTPQKTRCILVTIWTISWFGFCTPFYGYSFSESLEHNTTNSSLPCAKWFHISRINNYYYELYYVLIYIVSNAVMIVCYWQIFRHNRGRMQVRKALAKLTIVGQDNELHDTAKGRFDNERRLTKMSLAIVVSFMCCWGPHAVLSIVLVCIEEHSMRLEMLQIAFLALAYFSGVIHPLLYAFMRKSVRDVISSRFRSRSGSKVVPTSNSDLFHRRRSTIDSIISDPGSLPLSIPPRRNSLSSDFTTLSNSRRSHRRASEIVHICITRSQCSNMADLPELDENDDEIKSEIILKTDSQMETTVKSNLELRTKAKLEIEMKPELPLNNHDDHDLKVAENQS